MGYRWSRKSAERLADCHPALIALMDAAIESSPVDMTILCGHRTEVEQTAAFNKGASKVEWPNSRHNRVPALAVDVAPYIDGRLSWDWPHYYPMAKHIKSTWNGLPFEITDGWRLEWGGDWRSFKDGPHWQIVREE